MYTLAAMFLTGSALFAQPRLPSLTDGKAETLKSKPKKVENGKAHNRFLPPPWPLCPPRVTVPSLLDYKPYRPVGPIMLFDPNTLTMPVAKEDQPLTCELDVLPKSAFPQLPTVSQVPTTFDANEHRTHHQALREIAGRCGILTKEFRFSAPAHFPYPRFGAVNDYYADDGIVIYEGMRLVVAQNGYYEVQFTATSPAMPVTVRMQLFVSDREKQFSTLTLPPILLNPQDSFEHDHAEHGNCLHNTWQVRHIGYSPILAARFAILHAVVREGTARFGSLPSLIR